MAAASASGGGGGGGLREELLRLLERDRELRYAVMGLLGYRELLERMVRLEERFARLEERQQRLEEEMKRLWEKFAELAERQQKLEERFAKLEELMIKLEERFAELEERIARLEERFYKLEERFAELEERVVRLEERMLRLEEEMKKLWERMARLEEEFLELRKAQQRLEERQQRTEEKMDETKRVTTVIAHRFGVLSEEAFREAMKYVVEEELGVARVERLVMWDQEGLVYGHPSNVEVDLVVKDGVHILVEVKSRVSKGDVGEMYRIGLLYRRLRGVEPRLVIVGGFIDPDALELAGRVGVEIRPISRDLAEVSLGSAGF